MLKAGLECEAQGHGVADGYKGISAKGLSRGGTGVWLVLKLPLRLASTLPWGHSSHVSMKHRPLYILPLMSSVHISRNAVPLPPFFFFFFIASKHRRPCVVSLVQGYTLKWTSVFLINCAPFKLFTLYPVLGRVPGVVEVKLVNLI